MLSAREHPAVARALADVLADVLGPSLRGDGEPTLIIRVTLSELRKRGGPRESLAAIVLRESRVLVVQALLSVLHERTGNPIYAAAVPEEHLGAVDYTVTAADGRRCPATVIMYPRQLPTPAWVQGVAHD